VFKGLAVSAEPYARHAAQAIAHQLPPDVFDAAWRT
jgi:hypothetical protein